MSRSLPLATTLAVALAVAAPSVTRGQAGDARPQGFGSLADLNEHYLKREAENRAQQIRDLSKFAASKSGDEAEAAYRQAFNLAIVADNFEPAQEAARAYLDAHKQPSRGRALAGFVDLMASAQKKDYEGALKQMQAYVKAPAAERFEPGLILALGDPFLDGLIRAGKFDEARSLCRLLVDESGSSTVRDHFGARMERLGMLGKPAPAISGKDAEGKPVSLADFQGKVVLVDFWATWCPPCVAEAPALRGLRAEFKDKGFEILGVNLDGAREGQGDAAPDRLRRFLVEYGIEWPNVTGDKATEDAAQTYGVSQIPSKFLVDRDGKIVQVELSGEDLEKAVARILKDGDKGEAKAPQNGR